MHLYLHIPFCRRACHYCDFHFSTNLTLKSSVVEAICREIELQSGYLKNKRLETIYFGGGTPSLLNMNELYDIFETIRKYYTYAEDIEITMEANPDDITRDRLAILQRFGINRLSIGIQSFNDNHLKYLNRIHSSEHAESSVKLAQDMGFENITIDLIYGIHPLLTLPKKEQKNNKVYESGVHQIWHEDLAKAISLNVPHISSYCLTIEEKTVFGKWLQINKIPPIDEEFASQQFDILVKTLADAGYEQYEISNFCRDNQYSRHNTSYWKRHEYLGIGPSAHSFNGETRQFNVSNNSAYIKSLLLGQVPADFEILSPEDKVNDYIMTGLRTKWGCDVLEIEKLVGKKWITTNQEILNQNLRQGFIEVDSQIITLTQRGKLFADKIAGDLFLI
ncbi:oxygen-independent coproporphyrinogen III oxidase [Emticicia oligotrophica DSM 17448]|uniref:Heme chaperone HemW n=1 Tax=Emticicia oligotrophica (strain DSM 17448 / CIP 109782 / MTCC 6937 / GPTSA100-15) TaxID=929562 RepID=A0ABM5MWV2_EMTOG|nr:radical SAM family heme chaperone HemW [Emticicia oligotrophica]AFK01635.1 oxygen-independent coproporphyrinogen III oxidase [Emticicia oligotrophica DSM 17448]